MISIIIACHNGENYLSEAILNIKNQDVKKEIILVDDGSTDSTVEISKNLGCKTLTIPHSGTATARNYGIKHSCGEFIIFHDHDDILTSNSLKNFLNIFNEHKNIDVVMAKLMNFISPEIINSNNIFSINNNPIYGSVCSTMFRRSFIDKIGYFNENMYGESMEFMLRVQNSGANIIKAPFIALNRRIHNNNTGRTRPTEERKDYATALRSRLLRK
ncbi:MAG: glycosyltransferase family 2 protein [Desulfovibrio sp.]|nr:glycosyltransferase family 2 protein [Desulfovibrio sp.]